MKPLDNIRIVTLALNLPGPVAVARLVQWGAAATKIEPPTGDFLAQAAPDWYRALHQGQEVVRLDLKNAGERARLDLYLQEADLLITSNRLAALERLGLAWTELSARFPRLCQVAILGYPSADDERPGHDITYQARHGLLAPPHLPAACLADFGGAQDVVQAALALLLGRARGRGCHYRQVSLADAAEFFAEPLRRGVTSPGGALGGGLPEYNLYRTREGWVAVAALEPHFRQKLCRELALPTLDRAGLEKAFAARSAVEWEDWARARDLPIAAVRPAQARSVSEDCLADASVRT